MIHLKPGVKLTSLCPQMVLAISIAHTVYQDVCHADVWVTSANDGVHPGGARPSFHPLGKAVDLRCKNITLDHRQGVFDLLREALGEEFTVLWEFRGQDNEHFHAQYQGS